MARLDPAPFLELVLFENEASALSAFMRAGISSFLVDLEIMGKDLRQLGFDTEINPGTMASVAAISAVPGAKVWVRLNQFGPHTTEEIEEAVANGAHVLVLPMARTFEEVEQFVGMVAGRCQSCIMIETMEATVFAYRLDVVPIDYVYFGLNDFAIRRGRHNIFEAVADGTVAAARRAVASKAFGFGGVTHMSLGDPVPAALLLAEMARLDCQFSLLRRSFRRDLKRYSANEIVQSARSCWDRFQGRSVHEIAADHAALLSAIQKANQHFK